jgi:RHS repeat-associated protein
MVSSETHYDYGSGSAGAALSQRSTNYYGFTNSSALANNLIALPSSVTDTDEVTGQTSTTIYGYDAGTLASGTATPNTGSTVNGWNSTPLAGSYRGNQTSIQRYLDTSSAYLTTTKTFYNTGLVASVAEPPNSAVAGSLTTNYTYSSAYDGAYLTTLTDPEGNSSTFTYDVSSGLLTGSKDPNQVSSTYSYYPNMKLESATRQGGDHNLASYVSYAYPSPNEVEKTTLLSDDTSEVDTTIYDGLGRVMQLQHADPAGDEYVDTTYDPVGRKYTVSTPYRSKSDSTSYGLTTYSYDPLSRIQTIQNPDLTSVGYSYTGATTQYTNESNGTTSSTNLSRVDGLGRLTYVCEVTTSATPAQMGGDTPSNCNLEIAGTGFLTSSTQTLRGVTKSVQGSQTRTFVYDSLNRLTDSTNPESGHIHYVYDPDGNLYTKTAPAPNSAAGSSNTLTTTYTYNNIHQVLSKTYSGTSASSTPSATYNYGQTTVNGKTLEYPIERLTSESTTLGSTIQTTSIYSYDTDGRVASHYQCVTTMCTGTFEDVEYHYDGAGNAVTVSTPQVGYANVFDGAGHLTTVTPSWDPNANFPAMLVNASYAPNGGWSTATFGNGTTETYSYTPRWLTGMQVTNSSGSVYSFGLTRAADSQITRAVDSVNGTWNYTFDDFNRLLTAQQVNSSNAVINGLSWSYDRYGNRWSQNNTAGSVLSDTISYNTATNQATVNLTYDDAGNVLNDSSHTYTYDAENRIATVNGAISYIYDAEGRRVGKSTGSSPVTSSSTGSSGIIMVSGIEARHYFLSATGTYAGGCLAFDKGTASAMISSNSSSNPFSFTATVNWGRGDTVNTVASKLASAINSTAGSVVTATPEAAHPNLVDLLSTSSGFSTDYGISVAVNDTVEPSYPWFLSNPSFNLAATDMAGGEAANSGSGTITGTVYVVSLSGLVMDEIDNGTWMRSEFYADGDHVATANASGVVFIHADWLGTERARTNMAGARCQTTTNEPFGDDAVTTGSCAVNTPDFFTGKPRDTESNLDDFGARYLSSQWGRWMSPDWSAAPSGVPYSAFTNPQSLNLYAYVGNDPIDGQDPDGHREGFGLLGLWVNGDGEFADDGLTAREEGDLLAQEAGEIAASADTTDSSSASNTSEAQEANQQSQTTPASASAQAGNSDKAEKAKKAKGFFDKLYQAFKLAKKVKDSQAWVKAAKIDNERRSDPIYMATHDADLVNARWKLEVLLSAQSLISLGYDAVNSATTAGAPENVFGRMADLINDHGISQAQDLVMKSLDDGVNNARTSYMNVLANHIAIYGDAGDAPNPQ